MMSILRLPLRIAPAVHQLLVGLVWMTSYSADLSIRD
jgi:hypothetical protein